MTHPTGGAATATHDPTGRHKRPRSAEPVAPAHPAATGREHLHPLPVARGSAT